jgi:peptidylprolyl isomerase
MAITALIVAALLSQSATKLQMKDVKVGKGAPVKAGDFITVNYTGKLTNGKQFDSSVGRGPFKFLVGGDPVIKGWHLGFLGMKPGGKRKLTIPPDLGYGASGSGDVIPPNSTLVFDVELIKAQRATVKVTKQGAGPAATFGDSVEVHYNGHFPDGKKFDSSYDRGQPIPVTIGGGVIPGFTQGLLGMRKGEKRTVTIPYELAYGEKGRPPVIPPKATLVFDLEMMSITKAGK